MKTILKIVFLLSFILPAVGCKKATYNLNEEFTLKFNKSAQVRVDGATYKIKFKKVVEDSRCPPDAYCFWLGQVAVTITLDNETDLSIGHHLTIPSTADYENHTIQLLDVSYADKEHFGEENHCAIRLRID